MRSADDVLKGLLKLLERDLQKITIDIWFQDAKAVALRQDCFIIRTSTPYKKDTILSRYGALVKKTLAEMFSADMEFYVLDADEEAPQSESPTTAVHTADLEERYTFDNFIVGASNRFAHAAALAVASNPARSYNPLVIYGGSGLGKTHLMKAISNTLRRNIPTFRIIYMKVEDFMNEYVNNLRNKMEMEEFRSKYRVADILLVDDIQFIAGKEMLKEEFFHTIDTLFDSHKQVVLTSDRPPREILTLDKRLLSRFEMGLLADIQPPDYETRIAILKQKSEKLRLSLPDNLLKVIATNVTANIRQLEGIINHINADHQLEGCPVNMELVRRAIKDIFIGSGAKPTAPLIIEEVCRYYNITPERIKDKSQSKEVVLPRHVASYIIQQLTDLSLADIGKELGGRHHTTILSSIDRVKNMMREDQDFKNSVTDLINNLSEIDISTI